MEKINPKRTIESYDAIAPVYKEYSKKRKEYLTAIDNLVIERLRANMRILDVGAGNGSRLNKIISKSNIKQCIAIEPSSEMAKLCSENKIIEVYQTTAEEMNTIDIGKFDAILALWNVFGHITSSSKRLIALKNIAAKLNTNGIFILDVNNRHNANSYGFFTVLKRIIIDSFFFDESRGDAKYEWEISGKIYHGSGHLFTAPEIEVLFDEVGFKVIERCSVNYLNGIRSNSKYKGQLFYVLGLKK